MEWIKNPKNKESRREWLLHRFEWNAKKTNDGRKYQAWQRSNHPTALYRAEVIWQKIRYIHRNPLRAGLVVEAPHYLCSSAVNYLHQKGLLELTLYEGIVYKT